MMDNDNLQTVTEENSGTYNFDKFMDAILLEETSFRQKKHRQSLQEEPQRRRAWLRQERPLSRTYIKAPTGGN